MELCVPFKFFGSKNISLMNQPHCVCKLLHLSFIICSQASQDDIQPILTLINPGNVKILIESNFKKNVYYPHRNLHILDQYHEIPPRIMEMEVCQKHPPPMDLVAISFFKI